MDDDFDEYNGDARLGEAGIDWPEMGEPVEFDPSDVATCRGGPEDGRTVRWQGVPVVGSGSV